MTIDVQGPNGVTVQFPNGTDSATIDKVMRSQFAGTKQPIAIPGQGRLAQQPVGSSEDVAAKGLEGIPVLGAYVPQAGAAVSALAQPLTGAGEAGETYADRYAKNLAVEKARSAAMEQENPGVSTAANLIGGTAALGGLGATAAGARILGAGATTLPRQMAAGALSGAGISGADALARGHDPIQAGEIGSFIGAAAPVALRGATAALSPVISNVRAHLDPQGYAGSQLGRVMTESGQTPTQVADRVTQAAQEGQNMFTVADALGNPGQRALSTVTRAPGEGRTQSIDFLEGRQAGQGGRIANQLAEGFEAPETAAQTATRLTGERTTAANTNYGAARAQSGAVNVTPAIQEIDRTLQPGVTRLTNPQTAIANDSVEGALTRARNLLTDGRSQVSRFDEAFRVKQELDHMIDTASPTQQRVLIPVRNTLDDALAHSSPPYAAARDQFRQQSQAIEAVGTGQHAAMRGRTENTIPAFQGMRPDQQAAYRSGYVDPHIERVQGSAVGVDKSRPFTSDAFQAEAHAMAPNAEEMLRRIARERTMFETRNAAMGGSKTADNLADAAAMGMAPALAHQLVTGNVHGMARTAVGVLANAMTGNTPAVRQEMARLLLQRGGNITPQQLQATLQQAVQGVRDAQLRALIASQVAARSGAGEINRQGR